MLNFFFASSVLYFSDRQLSCKPLLGLFLHITFYERLFFLLRMRVALGHRQETELVIHVSKLEI